MDQDRIRQAAAHLGQLRQAHQLVNLPADLRPENEDQAYAVQAALHFWQNENHHADIVGYKIGCTTKEMQEILQIPGPAFGGIRGSHVYRDQAEFPFTEYQIPGIECEIAMRLSADLPRQDVPYTRQTVIPAIGACMAAIELVDNRYGDFLSIGTPVLIADDFFQSACILGAEVADWHTLDLADLEGRTFIDGKLAGTGSGSDVLGHPLEAVVWLANQLGRLGRGLKAGDLIMTGSLTPVQWLHTGSVEAMISIDGLGDVSLRLD